MSVKIASIFFDAVSTQRPLFVPIHDGYTNIFSLPAVELGADPAILEVHDFHQYDGDSNGARVMRTVTANEIAADILSTWVDGDSEMNPACRPGIWICGSGGPTSDEIALNESKQRAYAEVLILKGDALAANPIRRAWISDRMRKAVRWMSVERDWVTSLKDKAIIACRYCGKSVPSSVAICSNCHNVVNAEKYAELEMQKKAAIANASALLKQQPVAQKLA